ARPGVGRAELQGHHQPVALCVAGAAQCLDTVGVKGSRWDTRPPVVAKEWLPRLVQANLVFLDRGVGMRITDREAETPVIRARDVTGVDPFAVAGSIRRRTQRVVLAPHADYPHRLVEA